MIASIEEPEVIARILAHLRVSELALHEALLHDSILMLARLARPDKGYN